MKFRLILTLLTSNFVFVQGQIIVENSELLRINKENFEEHNYYKVFRAIPKKTSGVSMTKPIDGPCTGGSFTRYYFRKGKTLFLFYNKHSTSDTQYVQTIVIKGRRSPLMTVDSIKVGSKIKIGLICKDVSTLIKYATNHGERKTDFHSNGNITYYFKKKSIRKLTHNSKIKITRIFINRILPKY